MECKTCGKDVGYFGDKYCSRECYVARSKEDETSIKKKYYLSICSKSHGWQHMGKYDGYDSIEELKEENAYHFDKKDKYRITTMKLVEEGN
jgi:hypothetical protein